MAISRQVLFRSDDPTWRRLTTHSVSDSGSFAIVCVYTYNACLKPMSPETRLTDPGTLQPFLIMRHWPPDAFPDPELALDEPNGLLAAGGDLGPRRLLHAYRRGIFPWFSEGQPILWWSPDPRAVLWPDALRSSRSLRRTLRRGTFTITGDTAFDRVVGECAAVPRAGQDGTWITRGMAAAYGRLHRAGHAHSIECWRGTDLAGGLYGVAIGRVFFGESMFSRVSDASKAALAHLCTLGFELVDCQIPNPHLARLGAVEMDRRRFLALLDELCEAPGPYEAAGIGNAASQWNGSGWSAGS